MSSICWIKKLLWFGMRARFFWLKIVLFKRMILVGLLLVSMAHPVIGSWLRLYHKVWIMCIDWILSPPRWLAIGYYHDRNTTVTTPFRMIILIIVIIYSWIIVVHHVWLMLDRIINSFSLIISYIDTVENMRPRLWGIQNISSLIPQRPV